MSETVPITTLTDTDGGIWQVFTESSRYVIDLTVGHRTLTRTAGAGLGGVPGLPPLEPVSDLRLDGETVPLISMERCVVGERVVFWIRLPEDMVTVEGYQGTRRETTIVRAILRVDVENSRGAVPDARAIPKAGS